MKSLGQGYQTLQLEQDAQTDATKYIARYSSQNHYTHKSDTQLASLEH